MTKTTRLMLAVLAVCGTSAAMAQSSVNLYGRVNTSVESQKLGPTSASGMVSNGSFIGFKGTEDLGNGLKAGFVLEAGFNADNGSGNAGANSDQFNFSRNSEVNLTGNFGMLRMGSFDPFSYTVTADTISMHNHDTGTSADALYQINTSAGNKLAYRTPEIAGFTAEVQYSFGEKAGYNNLAMEETRGATDLGVNYANGPLGLGFGYSTQKFKTTGGVGNNHSRDQFALRASYAIGDLTLGAYYQRAEDETISTSLTKRNIYRLAAMYTLGASEFHANIGRASKETTLTGTTPNSAATQWTLAYNYNLSKRTKAYALYSKVNNGANSNFGPAMFGTSVVNGQDFRTFGVGVRHLF